MIKSKSTSKPLRLLNSSRGWRNLKPHHWKRISSLENSTQKHHESSPQGSRPKGFIRKILAKPKPVKDPLTVRFDGPISKRAQRPLGKSQEPIVSASDWMRGKEKRFRGLSDLDQVKKDEGNTVDQPKPSYTHQRIVKRRCWWVQVDPLLRFSLMKRTR
uniref:Uncharacterized protein n=1 Tax=Cucumis melo TaxID=3656 RepID=A0A9I9CK76_CUCME